MGFRPDPFIVALVVTAIAASALPATGAPLEALGVASKASIAVLFFLHGARLSTKEAIAGL